MVAIGVLSFGADDDRTSAASPSIIWTYSAVLTSPGPVVPAPGTCFSLLTSPIDRYTYISMPESAALGAGTVTAQSISGSGPAGTSGMSSGKPGSWNGRPSLD